MAQVQSIITQNISVNTAQKQSKKSGTSILSLLEDFGSFSNELGKTIKKGQQVQSRQPERTAKKENKKDEKDVALLAAETGQVTTEPEAEPIVNQDYEADGEYLGGMAISPENIETGTQTENAININMGTDTETGTAKIQSEVLQVIVPAQTETSDAVPSEINTDVDILEGFEDFTAESQLLTLPEENGDEAWMPESTPIIPIILDRQLNKLLRNHPYPLENVNGTEQTNAETKNETGIINTVMKIEETQPDAGELLSGSDSSSEQGTDSNSHTDSGVKMTPGAFLLTQFQNIQSPVINETPAAAQASPEIPLYESVLLQAIEGITTSIQDGITEFSIQMKPDFLGSLAINVMRDEKGALIARMQTSDPAVRGMLASQVVELRENLREKGIDLVEMEVVLQDYTRNQNSSQNNTRQNERREYNFPAAIEFNPDDLESAFLMAQDEYIPSGSDSGEQSAEVQIA